LIWQVLIHQENREANPIARETNSDDHKMRAAKIKFCLLDSDLSFLQLITSKAQGQSFLKNVDKIRENTAICERVWNDLKNDSVMILNRSSPVKVSECLREGKQY